jgi:hypothetical protein
MKNLLPLFACLLLFSCTPKGKVKNDWTQQNLKGNVKSIKAYTCKTVEKSGSVDTNGWAEVTTFNNSGFLLQEFSKKRDSLVLWRSYKYDTHNNLLEKEIHLEGKLVRREINKYDENNNMVEQTTFERDYELHADSLIKSDIHFVYKDSTDAKLVQSIATRKDKPWYIKITILNSKGNVTRDRIFYSWDTDKKGASQTGIYKYDARENMVEKDCFDADSTLDFKFVNKYNDKGNKTEEAAYKRKDTLVFREVKTYDSIGNMTGYTFYKHDGSINSDWHCEYKKFDAKGNWIEQVSYKNGKPETITERTIEYY